MRIHTDNLSSEDVYAAAKIAGVSLHRMDPRGSRSRARAFDVILEGTGRNGNSGRWGSTGEYRAATWDEWGIFLGEVFRRDPGAIVPRVYESADHFHWATGDRFRTLKPADQHARHKWEYQGSHAGGLYHVHHCTGTKNTACTAITRRAVGRVVTIGGELIAV